MTTQDPTRIIEELQAACHYSEEGGNDAEGNDLGSVDALIDYKNALEDLVLGRSIHIVCIRHPDFANEFEVFGGSVEIHDVDYGRSNLADPDEYAEWADGWQTTIAELRERGKQAVADCLAEAVRNGEGVR